MSNHIFIMKIIGSQKIADSQLDPQSFIESSNFLFLYAQFMLTFPDPAIPVTFQIRIWKFLHSFHFHPFFHFSLQLIKKAVSP